MKQNKKIVELEVRIMRLESIIDGFIFSVDNAANFNPSCGMCGANPLHVDSCQQPTCPHGLFREGE